MELKRNIGFWGASFLVLNGLIGAGIFALPAKMANTLGAASPWIFLLFGALMLSIVWCFGQLALKLQDTGGPTVYSEAAFGRFASFQTGWLYYLARATAIAANMHVLLLYASYLWPELQSATGQSLAILVISALLVWVNITGVKTAIRALDGITLLKLLPFVVLLSVGIVNLPDTADAVTLPALDTIGAGALLTLYAFIGFETVVVTSGETRKPGKTIPRALILTVIAIALFYFVVQYVYWHTIGAGESDSAPLIVLADVLFGQTGAIVMTLTAVFSVAGNLLANSISTSRLTFAMAKEKTLPHIFGHVHPRYATPDISIIVLGVFAAIMALSGGFVWLAIASVLARLLVYALCIVALMKLQRQHQWLHNKGRFKKAMAWGVPVLAIATCIWSVAQSDASAWWFLVGECAVGGLLYLALRKSSHFQSGNGNA
ncbi:APC family permease [Alteromonas sp. H39]|uniref:APC family permease n=1 Tax=Alteromonas sp. H39 TaxID=3389876 RepID=UPI0039E085C0